MTKNTKIADLNAAKTQHEKAQAALEKILGVVTGRDLPAIDSGAVDQARLDLADCLALRIVGEASEADEDQARAKLQTAEREFNALEAQHTAASLGMVGLNRMLLTAQQAKDNAAQTQAGAVNDWIFDELRIADEAFTKQAAELMRSYRRVAACAKALNQRGISNIGNYSLAPDLAIPVIGPASGAAFKAMHEGEPTSFGKLLHGASRVSPHQAENNEVERDLLDVMKSNSPIFGRIIKTLGGI